MLWLRMIQILTTTCEITHGMRQVTVPAAQQDFFVFSDDIIHTGIQEHMRFLDAVQTLFPKYRSLNTEGLIQIWEMRGRTDCWANKTTPLKDLWKSEQIWKT